jgi:tape measure domain-containing protein
MNNAEVLIKFKGDTTDSGKAIKQTKSDLQGLQKKGTAALVGFTTAVDAAVGKLAQMGVAYNADIETYITRLKTLTGSAESANDVLEQIKKDALTTPFDVSSLTQAESLLLSTGLSAEQSRKDILALGDAIAASGGGNAELSRMAVNLQQIKNVGKATALDIKQFAYAGIDIYGLLADSMGVTREEASELDVTYEMLSNALQKASNEGGKYAGAMEAQSLTYKGAMSNLQESFNVMAGELAEGLFTALKDVIPEITKLFNWITKNKDVIMAIAIPLLAFINVLSGLLIVKKIIGIIAAFNAVLAANPIFLIIAAIVALIAAFAYLWNHCEAFRNFWIGLWEGIKTVVMTVWNFLKGVFLAVVNFFKDNWKEILLFLINPFAGAFAYLYKHCEGFRNFVDNFVAKVKGFFASIPGFVVGVATKIYNAFASLPSKLLDIGKNIGLGLWNGLKGIKDWVIDKVKALGKSILKGLKSVLGIHSPSTETAWMADMLGLGMTKELDKIAPEIQKTIDSTFAFNPTMANTSSLNMSKNITVYNNVDVKQDALGQMVSDIKTFSGGAKNDYNYGMS